MQEVGVPILTGWQTFYVIIGAAAATLTGLMFVTTTLYARARVQASAARAGLEAFATPTVVHFGVVLLVAAILSAPWPLLWPAGLLLGVLGIGGVILVIFSLKWERRGEYHAHMGDWVWYRILPLSAYAMLILAAVLLAIIPALILFLVAGAVLLLLLIGIRNSWDSVTYLAIERSLADSESRD